MIKSITPYLLMCMWKCFKVVEGHTVAFWIRCRIGQKIQKKTIKELQ